MIKTSGLNLARSLQATLGIKGAFKKGETLVAPDYVSAPYQWLADGTAITGATSDTYTIVDADSGKKITLSGYIVVDGQTVTGQVTVPTNIITLGATPNLSNYPDVYEGTTFAEILEDIPVTESTVTDGNNVIVSRQVISSGISPTRTGDVIQFIREVHQYPGAVSKTVLIPYTRTVLPKQITTTLNANDFILVEGDVLANNIFYRNTSLDISYVSTYGNIIEILSETSTNLTAPLTAGSFVPLVVTVRTDLDLVKKFNFDTTVVEGEYIPTVKDLNAVSQRNTTNPKKIDFVFTEPLPDGYTVHLYIGTDINGNISFLTERLVNTPFTTNGDFIYETHVRVYIKDSAGNFLDPLGTLIRTLSAIPVEVIVPDPEAPPVEPDPTSPSTVTHLPETGPYTLAQIESLRTDGTTRGVTPGTIFKVPGTNALPAGMSIVGGTIYVATGAFISSLSQWDFTGYHWDIKGWVAEIVDCIMGVKNTSITTGVIYMWEKGLIGKIKRTSILGPGYYGNFSASNGFFSRGNGTDWSKVSEFDECEFIGWGADPLKTKWAGKVRRCYFDTAINLPVGTAKHSLTKAYNVGDWIVSTDVKYAYKCLVAHTNQPHAVGKNSNGYWQNQDPHFDCINPAVQYDPNNPMIIEACYINRSENLRAVDPGNIRCVGNNNAMRITRDIATLPLYQVIVRWVIASAADSGTAEERRNEDFPVSLDSLTGSGPADPIIMHDCWIGPNKGGSIFHSNETKHLITNVVPYVNPTSPLSANHNEAGSPSTGGTDPTPEPDPVVEPSPITIDNSVPAIVYTMGQSVQATMTGTYQTFNGPNRDVVLQLLHENMHYFWYNGKFTETITHYNRKLKKGEEKFVPNGVILIANALGYIFGPEKQFVFGAANESGSAQVSLWSDSGYTAGGGDRLWGPTKKVVDDIKAQYPQGITRFYMSWWASQRAQMPDWDTEMAPFSFKQTASGQPVAAGTIVGKAKQPLDHWIYDFNSTGQGTGLLPKTVPYDLGFKGPWSSDTDSRQVGVQRFVDLPQFQALGGVYGGPAHNVLTYDGSHPHYGENYGYKDAMYGFFMPVFLRAAGLDFKPSKFVGCYFAPDGSYAEPQLSAPNGGYLSTKQKVHKEPIGDVNSNYYQELFGFEIERASGGGRYWICRLGSTNIDPKYHGTVTIQPNGKAKIVMLQPIQPGDKISFMRSGINSRQDANHPYAGVWNGEMYKHYPVEHIPSMYDPNASGGWGWHGNHIDNFSPQWAAVLGTTVGTAASSTPIVSQPVDNTVIVTNVGTTTSVVQAADYNAWNDTTSGKDSGASTTIRPDTGVEHIDGTTRIGYVKAGEWLEYEINTAQTGNYNITTRLSAILSDRKYDLHYYSGTSTTPHDSVLDQSVINTGSYNTMANNVTSEPLNILAGRGRIRIFFKTNSMDFENITFDRVVADDAVPTPPQTNTFWTTGTNGPEMQDTTDVPITTNKIRHVSEVEFPSTLTTVSSGFTLFAHSRLSNNIIIYFSSGGTPKLEVYTVRDSTNVIRTPNPKVLNGGLPKDTKLTIDVTVDYAAQNVTAKITGFPDVTLPFASASAGTGVLGGGYLSFNGGSDSYSKGGPAGIKVYSHKAYLDDSTTPFWEIPNTAAEINASSDKISGSGNAT